VNRLLVLAAGFAAGISSVVVGQVVAQVGNDGTATLDCAGEFVDGGQLHCTIHDLVVTPTTAPPTTGVTTTTTTVPPRGVLFAEDFTDDTIADFTQRFDWEVVDLDRGSASWQGHHNMACASPDTERTLRHGPISNTDPGPEFWLCGPTGPASDHLMTSNGDDHKFGVTAFSPKPSFNRSNAKRVCWDVNLTESPGKRLWWEVQLIPATAVANAKTLAETGQLFFGHDFERGTARLAWGVGFGGTFQSRVVPAGSLVVDFTGEMIHAWQGPSTTGSEQDMAFAPFPPGQPWNDSQRFVTQDRAFRSHHCMTDNGNGTVTFSEQRPGQPDYVKTFTATFPNSYRVIFSAQNYDSGKDESLSSQTWHWDNILVSAS
jgi:hypothetical protein